MTTTAKIYLVGAGPGDPDLLTVKALRLIETADVVIYDRLVSPEIMALVGKSARLVPVGKAPGHHSVPQERINGILIEQARDGRCVVRLKGGDPLIFGRGSEEAEAVRACGIAVEYVPGITAAQGAASTTGVPLTHRGLAGSVRYVTGHRARDKPLDLDWRSLADADTTLVVYMGAANIGEITRNLMLYGLAVDTPVMAISRATTAGERRLVSTLGQIGERVRGSELSAPMLFVIGRVVSLYPEQATAVAVQYDAGRRAQGAAHA
jgi:uroporphyrin-III C-methyltransferase